MTTPIEGLEAITVRRANVQDADKIRYRVYSSPTEFIAVIAESALMAVRVSGINAPHKIMRDMPGDAGIIEAQRMAPPTETPSMAKIGAAPKADTGPLFIEMGDKSEADSLLFVPMGLADLQSRGMSRARILPAEMLQQIIEEHTAKQPIAAPEPVPEMVPESGEEPITEDPVPPAPEPTAQEKITQMADEILPPASASSAVAAPKENQPLTPEEVQQLLNE